MKEHLFIGGPADGKRLCIPDEYRVYLVPKREPFMWRILEKAEMKYPYMKNSAEVYHRTAFWYDDYAQVVFYLHESLCDKFATREISIMDILIDGYRKPNEQKQNCRQG
jgi:hypothetical protein